MKISSLNESAINFRGFDRVVTDKEGRILYTNHTNFFRGDLHWGVLTKYFDNFYGDFNNVNVYSLGCSDGSEPYTLAMMLKAYTQNPEKFFPIKACDSDNFVIDAAKRGIYVFDIEEYLNMKTNLGKKWHDYLDSKEIPSCPDLMVYSPKENLKNA